MPWIHWFGHRVTIQQEYRASVGSLPRTLRASGRADESNDCHSSSHCNVTQHSSSMAPPNGEKCQGCFTLPNQVSHQCPRYMWVSGLQNYSRVCETHCPHLLFPWQGITMGGLIFSTSISECPPTTLRPSQMYAVSINLSKTFQIKQLPV